MFIAAKESHDSNSTFVEDLASAHVAKLAVATVVLVEAKLLGISHLPFVEIKQEVIGANTKKAKLLKFCKNRLSVNSAALGLFTYSIGNTFYKRVIQ